MMKKLKRVCDICGQKGAILRRVTRSYGSGRSLLVIEKVPVIRCPHCGETYLEAHTMHELERLKMHRRSLASKRSVPVLAFA